LLSSGLGLGLEAPREHVFAVLVLVSGGPVLVLVLVSGGPVLVLVLVLTKRSWCGLDFKLNLSKKIEFADQQCAQLSGSVTLLTSQLT
jgi:hypothetical protein